MPIYLNRHQPRRPVEDKILGRRFMFRTYPKIDNSSSSIKSYRTCVIANRLMQMSLYRWCRSDDYINGPAISELYDFLAQPFGYGPSKGHLGRTVVNAVDYDPRRLKGKDKQTPKACQIYLFREREDLQYGLEYQICAWLRRFLADHGAPEDVPSGPEAMEEELDMLAGSDHMEFMQIYVEPMMELNAKQYEEPNWRQLLRAWKPDTEMEPEAQDKDYTAPVARLRNFSRT